MRCATPAGCSPARRWCTAIRTAGATRRRSSTAPRRSGSCAWTSPTSRRAASSRLSAEDVLGTSGPLSAEHYAKSNDILDVWFDSGSTFFHVLRGSHPGTTSPDDDGKRPEADLYLEGHDQHRGWFHSSLLIA